MKSLFLHRTRVLLPVEGEKHNCHVSLKRFLFMMTPYNIPDRCILAYMFHLKFILVLELASRVLYKFLILQDNL